MEGRKMSTSPSFARSVSERLAERQETSEARRRYLQRLARLMCSRARPRVQFVNGIPTARCRESGSDFFIEVGSEVIDQTVTNLPREVWSLVAQEGLIVHEIGHVLYTDFGAHEEIRRQLGTREMSVFHDVVFNPAEDAAIEEQLRQSFDCADELDAYNANLFENQKNGARHLSITNAVKIAILEKGCYDAGAVEEYRAGERQLVAPEDEEVFDDLLAEVNDLLADVMTEPEPGKRYQRMLEFWNHLCDVMQDHGDDPNSHDANDGYDGKPDDTSGMTDGEAAERLDELDEGEVEEQVTERGQPEDWDEFGEDDADEAQEGENGASDGEESDEAPSPGDEDGPGETGGENGDEAESGEAGDGGSGEGEAEDGDESGGDGQAEGDETDGSAGDDGGDDGGDGGGDGAGSGSGGSPDGDDGPRFPGHEDHRLVLTD